MNDILSDMESKGHSDVQMLHPLVEQETANLTIAYFCRDQEVLQTTEQDVRELGRKYNPKWLSGDFASTVFSFLVRIVRVSRLETVQPTDVRTAAVRALTNDLLKGLANLEQKVMRCMPK